MKRAAVMGLCLLAGWATVGGAESRYDEIGVGPLQAPVTVDGDLADWVAQGREQGVVLPLIDSEWESNDGQTGERVVDPEKQVRLWVGHRGERFYLAAQWRDETRNAVYKPWKLSQGGGYQRARTPDDMFVVRLQMGDSFSQCMLSSLKYRTDVWRWSAGRSNLSGVADDMSHVFSGEPFDKPSREYEGNKGTVFFLSTLDSGYPGWQAQPQPKAGSGPVVASVVKAGDASGSRADVAGVGQWKEGVWTLEMSRALQTLDPEDAVFAIGGENVAQFAVFFAGYQLRKFITKPVALRFSAADGGR
ncbi:MAG: hypothetical protein HQM02_06700 [Magnetococcales bacterium]|nr:hypothetical protein [Magnetococcales bacterium]